MKFKMFFIHHWTTRFMNGTPDKLLKQLQFFRFGVPCRLEQIHVCRSEDTCAVADPKVFGSPGRFSGINN